MLLYALRGALPEVPIPMRVHSRALVLLLVAIAVAAISFWVNAKFTTHLSTRATPTPYSLLSKTADQTIAQLRLARCGSVSIFKVANDSQLSAAIKAAVAGDVIALAPGVYKPVVIYQKVIDEGYVAITSQDPTNQAVLTTLQIYASSGLVIDTIRLSVPQSTTHTQNPNTVTGSDRVMFNNVLVEGVPSADSSINLNGGLMIRNSTQVSVANSEFTGLQFGLSHLDSSDVKIVGNYFHELRHDAVRGGGTSKLEISGNYITDIYPDLAAGDHPDGIQLWTKNVTGVTKDVKIVGNVIVRGDGAPVQGIFIRDDRGTGFDGLVVRDNLVVGTLWHGITLSNTRLDGTIKADSFLNAEITGNRVYALADQMTWIMAPEGTAVLDNVAAQFKVPSIPTLVDPAAVLSDAGKAVIPKWLTDKGTRVEGLSADFLSAYDRDAETQNGAPVSPDECEIPVADVTEAAPVVSESDESPSSLTNAGVDVGPDVAPVSDATPVAPSIEIATAAPQTPPYAATISGPVESGFAEVFGFIGGPFRGYGEIFDGAGTSALSWSLLGMSPTFDVQM